jgi:hypothetical protein
VIADLKRSYGLDYDTHALHRFWRYAAADAEGQCG